MPSSSPVRSSKTGIVAVLCHDPALVGGVAVALMLGTYGLFGLPVDLPLLVAGFCGTTLAYLVDRGWAYSPEDRVNRPGRMAWTRAHMRWLTAETTVLFALGGAMAPYLNGSTLLCTGLLGSVALLQVWPLGPGGAFLGGILKPIAIAGAWAAGGALLPLIEAGQSLGAGPMLFFGCRWLFILPNLLLADWGDRVGDAEAGLAPWAAGWTVRQVRWMATISLLLAATGAVIWAVGGTIPLLVGFDALGLVLMAGVVWGLDPARPRTALLADLVVGWPLVPTLVAWMIV